MTSTIRNQWFKLAFATCLLLTCYSCSQTNIHNEDQLDETLFYKDLAPPDLMKVGHAIFESNSNDELFSFIYGKSLERFDGDQDFLFGLNLKETLPTANGRSGFSFQDLMNQSLNQEGGQIEDVISSILKERPLLNINFPNDYMFDSDTLSLNDYVIVPVPDNVPESKIEKLYGFDISGKEYLLDAKSEPNVPVLVLRDNDRLFPIDQENQRNAKESDYTDFNGVQYTNTGKNYAKSDDLTIFKFEEELPPPPGGGGGGNTDTRPDREKYSYKRDRVTYARFISVDAKRQFEYWYQGDPEMYLLVLMSKKQSVAELDKSQNPVIRDWIGSSNFGLTNYVRTVDVDIDIVQWKKEVHGDQMKYIWYETDGHGLKDVNYSYTNTYGSSTVTVNGVLTVPDDKMLVGENIIPFTDSVNGGKEYRNGSMVFGIKLVN